MFVLVYAYKLFICCNLRKSLKYAVIYVLIFQFLSVVHGAVLSLRDKALVAGGIQWWFL